MKLRQYGGWIVGMAISALSLSGCASVPVESLIPGDDDLLVATFNVHYISPRADAMSWDRRESAVLEVIRDINADLIALQEMETFTGGHFSADNVQLASVLEAFPEYDAAAVGDPAIYPSTQPIVYRRAVLEPVDQGFFYFSPTPDTIYSRPWHARFPAFASWVRFRRRADGSTFYVFNIHTDSSSPRNRMKAARLVVERIAARLAGRGSNGGDDPVILLGDFNAPASFPSFRIYARAGFSRTSSRGSTFHFNRGWNLIPAIDHILSLDGAHVRATSVVRHSYDGVWPSDHYPVAAVVEFE